MRLFEGTRVKTNMAEFSAECHSVDCSGDSKVLTELDSNKISFIYLQHRINNQRNTSSNSSHFS